MVGDSEYWHLTGAANLAFLKPIAEGVTTNVALVCESGRIYSFLVTEQSVRAIRIWWYGSRGKIPESDPGISPLAHQPAFVARTEVAAYRELADAAIQSAREAQANAERQVAEATARAQGETEAFRADYPTRLQFAYRLSDRAREWPFMVEAMWHDGRFTYLRSHAQESPALYEQQNGDPALIAYDLNEDGLYIVRRVVGDGWLQIGDNRARWRFAEPEFGP